ncbi:CXXC-type zinc finger protein 1 isoform X2 [Bubalus bubalis]|uniref:CXXC-type zinc finger protein 1 isoform X2 n=1 Tax=Bubalus bubalis TaxID=89462 RepID=UPI001E1B77E1|nr:CXXC-type zinc finger protein 1 isoform X2 [Bubalus bubalis]
MNLRPSFCVAVCQDKENNKHGGNSIDMQIFCVSCGKPINYEHKSSIRSMYPTCIEGATRLFCDVYNPQSERYCKQLQVLGPKQCSGFQMMRCAVVH